MAGGHHGAPPEGEPTQQEPETRDLSAICHFSHPLLAREAQCDGALTRPSSHHRPQGCDPLYTEQDLKLGKVLVRLDRLPSPCGLEVFEWHTYGRTPGPVHARSHLERVR